MVPKAGHSYHEITRCSDRHPNRLLLQGRRPGSCFYKAEPRHIAHTAASVCQDTGGPGTVLTTSRSHAMTFNEASSSFHIPFKAPESRRAAGPTRVFLIVKSVPWISGLLTL